MTWRLLGVTLLAALAAPALGAGTMQSVRERAAEIAPGPW